MRAGEHVTPQVRLVRPIGSGGMGSVWVADHLALKTQVAVKFILAGRENDSEARERFSREAEAAAQVKSPHVTQIFDHGVAEDGVPFIVMELLEGEDLARYLHVKGNLPLREAAAIVTQVCRTLARAHAKGLIHRDVKPANIFLCDVGTPERFVKLLDFGVAKMAGGDPSTATKSGSVTGTPVYMAPEQLLGSRELDHRADLWSVAVLSYELITGRRPCGEETAAAIALRVHTKGMPRASEGMEPLPPEATEAIDAFFAKAWSTNPSGRHESATQFAEDLDALVRLLQERHGLTEIRSVIVASVPRVEADGTAPTVNELPEEPIGSARTLASGRAKVADVAPESSAKPPVVVVSREMPATPHTETPISRHVRESNAAITTPPAGRHRWSAAIAAVLAGVVIVAFAIGRRSAEKHVEPPLPTPATSSVPSPKEVPPSPPPSVTAAPSPSIAPAPSSSVAPAPSPTIVVLKAVPSGTAKKPPPAPSTSASAKKKPLEEIE
ncbi:MAG: protein kinase domain-containing protein [Polyangiales bacterium]